jgi:hypothetical protein
VNVTGTAHCNQATGHDTYTLEWTVENTSASYSLIVQSAVESGAWDGVVSISPNPIPAASDGTGSDGPVPGDTTGTVTLTVDWQLNIVTAVIDGTSTGTIDLDGSCVTPETTTTSGPSTTAAEAVVRAQPRFTG